MAKANWLVLSVLVVLSLAAFAAAQSYTVTDLGPGAAHAINNLGDVVVVNNSLSYLWTPTHSSQSLQPLPGGTHTAALGINSHGEIVGESDGPGNYHTVLWREGNPHDLGTLPGGIFSAANAVNATGEIAGTADTTQYGSEAMVWTQAMGMQGLGFLLGGNLSAAYAINRFGQVVGWSTVGNGGAYPFLWSKTTGMIALPLPTGSGGYAYAINDLGQIAGIEGCGIVCVHAVLWSKKGSFLDLGVLPRASVSYAYGINNVDQVVGASGYPTGNVHAFVWSSTSGMQDLNNMISANTGWLLRSALAINASGQIVGYGTLNGQAEAFLLTPQ